MMACGEGGWGEGWGRGTADAQVVMSTGHDGLWGGWVGGGVGEGHCRCS